MDGTRPPHRAQAQKPKEPERAWSEIPSRRKQPRYRRLPAKVAIETRNRETLFYEFPNLCLRQKPAHLIGRLGIISLRKVWAILL